MPFNNLLRAIRQEGQGSYHADMCVDNLTEDLKELYGAVPPGVAMVAVRLIRRSQQSEVPVPDDFGYNWLIRAVRETTLAIQALSDARAILTAYSREFADPRPSMTDLASAQGISPTTLRRRYKTAQVESLKSLLESTGTIDDIIRPFPSLFDRDLQGVSEELDEEIAIRDRIAAAYEVEEIALAKKIGVPIPSNDDTDPYYADPIFEKTHLYPKRRRRIMGDYNERIMEDVLSGHPDLYKYWNQLRGGNVTSVVENPTEPPF